MDVLAQVKERGLIGRRAVVASLIGAAFTAVCAQVTIPLPGHLVPITLQVFAVLCCGMMLGSRYGALAQLEYIAAGLAGAPIFAFHRAGLAALTGPSGGYIVGFAAAAFVVGLFVERVESRSFASCCYAGLLGVGIIYTFGAAWLMVWTHSLSHGWMAWTMGAAPYIGVDVVKTVAAARLCCRRWGKARAM